MKLSVIVPCYNVSNYLEECVGSIVSQNINSMEILIINDGSTDNTLEIAQRLEHKYSQIKVINQPNGGLGNARNTGVSHARGDYLTFVDSDDIVAKDAYKKMLSIIEKSNSDFIIGNVIRFNSKREFPSVLHQRIFTENFIGVNVHTHHELLYDTTAWNKIFRMNFWKKHAFSFPEKMLFEDIPVTLPAHAVAQKVDILTDIVYKWRARDDGDKSITQQNDNIMNFRDRIRGIDMVRNFFEKNQISKKLKDAYDYKNLSMDFPLYLNYMLDASRDYQKLLKDYVKTYLKNIDHSIFMELTLLLRLKYRLIELDRFNDFLSLLEKDIKKEINIRPVETPDGHTFNYPYLEVLSAKEQITQNDFDPISWLEEVKWEKGGLRIKGVAYLNKLDSKFFKKTNCKIFLENETTNEIIELYDKYSLKRRTDVKLKRGGSLKSKRPFKRLFNYTYSGFDFLILPSKLDLLQGDDSYSILMELENEGVKKLLVLGAPLSGYRTKPIHRKSQNRIISLEYNAARQCKLSVSKIDNYIDNIMVSEEGILLKGKTFSKEKYIVMYSERSDIELRLPVRKNEGTFTALIPPEIYQQILYTSEKEKIDEVLSFKFMDEGVLKNNFCDNLLISGLCAGQWQLTIIGSNDSIFRLRLGDTLPIVTNMKAFRTGLQYQVKIPNSYFENIIDSKILMRGKNSTYHLDYEVIDESKQVSTLLVTIPNNKSYADHVYAMYFYKKIKGYIPSRYTCIVDSLKGYDNPVSSYSGLDCKQRDKLSETEYLIPICLFNIGEDKITSKENGVKYELFHPTGKNHLHYQVSSYWEKIDDGPRRQEVVRKIFYPLWRRLPIKNNYCLIESFWGREFSDNPKAVYDYLSKQKSDMKFILSVQDTLDGSIVFNKNNTKIVKTDSWRYIYYLARSKYFVNNVNFPEYYTKQKKAIEIQTMHGTPLKKLGLDSPGEILGHQKNEFIKKCNRWDYLIIPSDYVGEIAQSAFHFENRLLKIGYPRNDSLFVYNNDIKNELLSKYNLPSGKKIILYAPTWRTKGKFSMPLNLEQMKSELGNEYILLIKLHHYMIPNFSLKGMEDFAFVFDKGTQISDFYKLADMLITDYSSVMFDFAILNKPMLFFTYDYENYKNNLRGLYFDFKKEAPGPLVFNTASLIEEIRHIDDYAEKYKIEMTNFRKKFVQYDSGNACKRLAENIFLEK